MTALTLAAVGATGPTTGVSTAQSSAASVVITRVASCGAWPGGRLVVLVRVLTDHAKRWGRDRLQETGPIRGRGVAPSSGPALTQPEL